MNPELKKSLEMRQENLITLLKEKKDSLEIEKQHQIYGAVKEIDYILRMMKATEEEEDEEDSSETDFTTMQAQEAVAANGTHGKQVELVQVEQKTKKFKFPFSIKFEKDPEE
jgi:hypothetical protein